MQNKCIYKGYAMLYRVEAFEGLPGGQEPGSDVTIVKTSYALLSDDVYQATYRFLLSGYWVRVSNGRSGRPISGLFNPAKGLPTPETILPKDRCIVASKVRLTKPWQESEQEEQELVFSPEPVCRSINTVHG